MLLAIALTFEILAIGHGPCVVFDTGVELQLLAQQTGKGLF